MMRNDVVLSRRQPATMTLEALGTLEDNSDNGEMSRPGDDARER